MSLRIEACFAQLRAEGRTGVIPYVPVGFPTLAETPALARAAIEGGACLLELGVPFSDPLADGATIQRASGVALEQGVGMADCLEVARALRVQGAGETPLVFMGYYNTFLSYGLDRFCRDAAAAGVDGMIVVDMPPEEAAAFLAAAHANGLHLIFLLAPTSTTDRERRVAAVAGGFIYCVSLAGVTGARSRLPDYLPDFIAGIRRQTPLPLAIGFGISQRAHVEAVGELAEAAVIGSALVDLIERTGPGQRPAAVRAFVADLCGPGAPAA
ncbi:MAG: tryptophan synthase subunit alpha [Chloroflexota bacterium]